ncbi:hypothetical protein BJ875DRAFT_415220 [Amylocarpus encephaloides]|uniref:Prolyl 4-hydroxylase alpha subunit domain-containing protein n=1 Tax=Amylocarpus encephaloides TaxID=45428 RepID=A0A9P7YSH5_9HELO|nr:hypothetical protein BJ875DRAFT_415220 [Amylocarpus encephaloides]
MHTRASFLDLILFWLLQFSNHAQTSCERQILISESPCLEPPYIVHMFNRSPLMIYIENFVSAEELHYIPSEILLPQTNDSESSSPGSVNSTHRTSKSTYFYANTDPIVDCIAARAASFQGLLPSRLEPLQVVKYETNGHFAYHRDTLCDPPTGEAECTTAGDRETTFFVYLKAEGVVGGETDFLNMRWMPGTLVDKLWCNFLKCGDEHETLSWLPTPGNALFWENVDGEGKPLDSAVHAGLPVTEGEKMGLNIWTGRGIGINVLGISSISMLESGLGAEMRVFRMSTALSLGESWRMFRRE